MGVNYFRLGRQVLGQHAVYQGATGVQYVGLTSQHGENLLHVRRYCA